MAFDPSSGDRWEQFKPVIELLYMSEKKKLSEVAETMKRDHEFDAGENQYKYHFKKWRWKRSLSAKKKAAVAAELQTRALIGKGPTTVTCKGRAVDAKKIRRHLKESLRQGNGVQLTFANRIFLKWNMPYAAMQEFHFRSSNRGPTLPFSVPTPASDIEIATPSVSAVSPLGAPSPTTTVVKTKTAMDRARLFFEGRHDQLIASMDRGERIIMSEWLYQYWYYGFKTAKTWGRGPREWTAASLQFDDFRPLARRSLPSTPGDMANTPSTQLEVIARPSDLCRWLIHVPNSDYFGSEDDSPEMTHPTPDPNDESTWTDWPATWQDPPLNTRLRDALEHNDFSTVKAGKLPVAVPQIAAAAKRSPSELFEESLGFAIMSRNLDLVRDTADKVKKEKVDVSPLYPLHLATSYLDGSKSCCDILRTLLRNMSHSGRRESYINDHGHTVLDNLMIAVLKAHSSVKPHELCDSLRNMSRFPGEEVDICGRWDADSDCIRQLYTCGNSSIPFQWKHKFCHTSVQAVCHCIMTLHVNFTRTFFSSTSGLYVRQCFSCGLKLQLQPLHTLVLTAFHLVCSGCEGEDLFGMVACLLCLLACGVNPRNPAPISMSSLFHQGDLEDVCDHEDISPCELSRRLSTVPAKTSWSHQGQIGWRLFCTVLSICTDGWDVNSDDEGEDVEVDVFEDFIGESLPDDYLIELHAELHTRGIFGDRKDIASLWAAVQAEILTYRRLDDESDWLSSYFDMEMVLANLEHGYPASTRFIEEGLLETHCSCGWLVPTWDRITTLENATTEYIANLDVWERATYSVLGEI
ncbi:hypothetical protein BCR34DRAFT_598820 [Clohesyomyces aquaticus]|uniref:Clr5 domain-containing protein n=1 Tax=Clohesyomyces aquaticus TaxID=1231657 RepID=A0A1Y1ZXH4_9PLEO|nr:hypothetical protein BCR34DRAFT_598820 [Clohesyomyces aquaticus]